MVPVDYDVETNLSPGEEISLVNAFRGLGPQGFTSAQVPYVGDVDLPGEGDSIVADDAAKARLVSTMLLAPPAQSPLGPVSPAVKT